MPFTPRFEQTTCDNCGCREEQVLFSGPDRLHGLPGRFTLVRCLGCGWLRVNPRPVAEDLAKYYPEDYVAYAHAIEDEKHWWARLDRQYGVAKQARAIERYCHRGRILEVGCGTGTLLNEMKKRGWSVVGIEPNEHAANYARTRFGMEIFNGTLEEYNPEPESFDVVCAWNVVEHLPSPAQDMTRMQRALKKGGLLVMSIPNLESPERCLFGEAWLGWDLPRHIYQIPRPALDKFLAERNMRVIGTGYPSGSYHATLLSVQFLLRERMDCRTADAIVEIFKQFPIRVLTIPLFWAIDRLNLSSLQTYYCRLA